MLLIVLVVTKTRVTVRVVVILHSCSVTFTLLITYLLLYALMHCILRNVFSILFLNLVLMMFLKFPESLQLKAKLSQLGLPDFTINWILSLLSDHSQAVVTQ